MFMYFCSGPGGRKAFVDNIIVEGAELFSKSTEKDVLNGLVGEHTVVHFKVFSELDEFLSKMFDQ